MAGQPGSGRLTSRRAAQANRKLRPCRCHSETWILGVRKTEPVCAVVLRDKSLGESAKARQARVSGIRIS